MLSEQERKKNEKGEKEINENQKNIYIYVYSQNAQTKNFVSRNARKEKGKFARKIRRKMEKKNSLVSRGDIRVRGSELITSRELFCPGYFRGYFRETFGSNGKR